tara:strand:- start:166 stop:1125 length:960 start_codon:yes stop_codon:yes gene_type:complete
MNKYILEFEKPLKNIEDKIESLRKTAINTGVDVSDGILNLQEDLREQKKNIYGNLSRWQRVQLARHPNRPHAVDFINGISDFFFEIHGDRKYSDDKSVICGIGRMNDLNVVFIGQEKGRGTKDKVFRNFGMMRPEGYRKALRVMRLAEKFSMPIISFIDTPGAYPGIGAEERGQAQAIAENLLCMSNLKVPTLSIVIGEGASGGALGIGLTDKIICFENTWYSVISPEGCASILFRDTGLSEKAADAMKVTAGDLKSFDIADHVISEPLGGIHLDYAYAFKEVKDVIHDFIEVLQSQTIEELIANRHQKYQNIGVWKNE